MNIDPDYDTMPLGELIDEMYRARESKRAFEAEIKEINGEISKISERILDKMNELGVSTIRSTLASVSITEQTVPQVDDFDEVLDWIEQDFESRKHIMWRRVSSTAWQEFGKLGEDVPGIRAYVKRGIGLRKLQS